MGIIPFINVECQNSGILVFQNKNKLSKIVFFVMTFLHAFSVQSYKNTTQLNLKKFPTSPCHVMLFNSFKNDI